jgi:hypothetical protein
VDDHDAAPHFDDPFDQKLQLAGLDYLFRSDTAATAFAENYVGLPY